MYIVMLTDNRTMDDNLSAVKKNWIKLNYASLQPY